MLAGPSSASQAKGSARSPARTLTISNRHPVPKVGLVHAQQHGPAVPRGLGKLEPSKRLHDRHRPQQRILQQAPQPLLAHVLALRRQGRQVRQLHRVRRPPLDHRAYRQLPNHRLAQARMAPLQATLYFLGQLLHRSHRFTNPKWLGPTGLNEN
jgi:hypothetical protein